MSLSAACSICFEVFDQPTVTLCGHSFCCPCLAGFFYKSGADEIECPICRNPVTKDAIIKINTHTSFIAKLTCAATAINSSRPKRYGKWTDLHEASKAGDFELVRELVNAGANIHLASDKKTQGMLPIHEAGFAGHLDIVKYFTSKDDTLAEARTVSGGLMPIHCAAHGGKIDVVAYFLDECNVNIEVTLSSHGRTPLHCASNKGKLDLVKYLIDRGANYKAQSSVDDLEDMPIHLAAYFGHLDIVRYYIEEVDGDLLFARNRNGEVILHLAALTGRFDVVKYLVKTGRYNLAAKSSRCGRTPLHAACNKGHFEIAKYLILNGADIRASDADGWSMLHCSAYGGHIHITKFIMSKAPSLMNAKNLKGELPYDVALLSPNIYAPFIADYLE